MIEDYGKLQSECEILYEDYGKPISHVEENLDISQKTGSILWLHKVAYIGKDIAIVCQKLLHYCPLDSMIILC